MRILIPQRVPVFNVRGERLLGVTEYHDHPSHNLLPLLHVAKIKLLSQQPAEGRWSSRRLRWVDRCVSFPPEGDHRVPPDHHSPSRLVLQAPANCTEPSSKVYRTAVDLRRCGPNPWLSR